MTLVTRFSISATLAVSLIACPGISEGKRGTTIDVSGCSYLNDFNTPLGAFNSSLVQLGDVYYAIPTNNTLYRIATLTPSAGEVISEKPIKSRTEHATFKLDDSVALKIPPLLTLNIQEQMSNAATFTLTNFYKSELVSPFTTLSAPGHAATLSNVLAVLKNAPQGASIFLISTTVGGDSVKFGNTLAKNPNGSISFSKDNVTVKFDSSCDSAVQQVGASGAYFFTPTPLALSPDHKRVIPNLLGGPDWTKSVFTAITEPSAKSDHMAKAITSGQPLSYPGLPPGIFAPPIDVRS